MLIVLLIDCHNSHNAGRHCGIRAVRVSRGTDELLTQSPLCPCRCGSALPNSPFGRAKRAVLACHTARFATQGRPFCNTVVVSTLCGTARKNIKYYKNRFAKAIAPCGMMPGVNARQRQSVTPRLAPPDCRGMRPAPPRPHRRVQTRALRRARRQPPIQRALPHSRP